jgi:hypothetical protein
MIFYYTSIKQLELLLHIWDGEIKISTMRTTILRFLLVFFCHYRFLPPPSQPIIHNNHVISHLTPWWPKWLTVGKKFVLRQRWQHVSQQKYSNDARRRRVVVTQYPISKETQIWNKKETLCLHTCICNSNLLWVCTITCSWKWVK